MQPKGDVTLLLHAWSEGDRSALDRLVPLVYGELRRLAHRRMSGERPGHTLQTTALVHETFIRMVGLERIGWQDRGHFFAMAARAMRRVLVDHAARRKAQKRKAVATPRRPDVTSLTADDEVTDILSVNRALVRLERLNERHCRVVECRVFAGLGVEETAHALGVSAATVKRDWAAARAWLNRELAP